MEIERRLPDDARRVAALDEWVYPLYGPKLERHVVPLPGSDPLPAAERLGLDWVVVGSREGGRLTRTGWRRQPFSGSGWTLFSR